MLPIHSKLGRVALGLGVRDLAEKVPVSPNTIVRLERGETLRASTLEAIRAALEDAGAILIEADEEAGPGVRVKDREATNVPSAG